MKFNLDETIGYAMNRCVILLRLKLAQKFRESGYEITPEEWVILNRLWQKEGRSQNEIAETTIKDKTTVTRFLNRMERKGLVLRQSSSEDARVKLIFLTLHGKALEGVLIPIAEALLSAGAAEIDQEEFKIALSVLKKIERNLIRIS